MNLNAQYMVQSKRRDHRDVQVWITCGDICGLLDKAIPEMLRRRNLAEIDVLQRISAEDVNTWDVFTVIGEEYLNRGDTCLFFSECSDGFAFKRIQELQEYGPDMHITLWRHCSPESFGIKES